MLVSNCNRKIERHPPVRLRLLRAEAHGRLRGVERVEPVHARGRGGHAASGGPQERSHSAVIPTLRPPSPQGKGTLEPACGARADPQAEGTGLRAEGPVAAVEGEVPGCEVQADYALLPRREVDTLERL